MERSQGVLKALLSPTRLTFRDSCPPRASLLYDKWPYQHLLASLSWEGLLGGNLCWAALARVAGSPLRAGWGESGTPTPPQGGGTGAPAPGETLASLTAITPRASPCPRVSSLLLVDAQRYRTPGLSKPSHRCAASAFTLVVLVGPRAQSRGLRVPVSTGQARPARLYTAAQAVPLPSPPVESSVPQGPASRPLHETLLLTAMAPP